MSVLPFPMPYKDPEKAKEHSRKLYAKRKADPRAYEKHLADSRASYRKNAKCPKYLEKRRKRSKRWREENLDACAAMMRRHNLKRFYGITEADFDELLESQGHVCAICGGDNGERNLAVDHCHDTGKIRGLLCHNCNLGIGSLKHDPSILQSAIEYLAA